MVPTQIVAEPVVAIMLTDGAHDRPVVGYEEAYTAGPLATPFEMTAYVPGGESHTWRIAIQPDGAPRLEFAELSAPVTVFTVPRTDAEP